MKNMRAIYAKKLERECCFGYIQIDIKDISLIHHKLCCIKINKKLMHIFYAEK